MICAVVLAAGESRRMGQQKLLMPWGQKTVIEHIVDELLTSRIDGTLVVTGHDHPRLQTTLSQYPVTLVNNERYDQGMLSSVRCGLRALPDSCEGVLVALGDQPSLSSVTINRLMDPFLSHRGIVVPTHQGRRGHPLIFSPAYIPRILTEFDAVGLRGLLQACDGDIREIPLDTADILWDLDTPEDYQRRRKSPSL